MAVRSARKGFAARSAGVFSIGYPKTPHGMADNGQFLRVGLCWLLALAAAFLNLRNPAFPGAGLDPSWLLSTDHAVRTGAVFGRDYVFTYGPYFRLVTRLFDPDRFGLVVAYDLIVPLFLCAPALRSRSVLGVLGVVGGLMLFAPSPDALIMTALLAVFLTAVMRRDLWAFAAVAVCGPLMLSKLSLALVMPPLLILADARWAAERRAPLLTPVLLASMLASLLLAGQPLDALPAFASNSLAIILGYGRAMQLAGPVGDLVFAVALCGLTLLLAASIQAGRAAERFTAPAISRANLVEAAPILAALGGLVWFLFIAMKAGFVRQDAHATIAFEAVGLGLVVVLGSLARPAAVRAPRPGRAVVFSVWAAAILTGCFVGRDHVLRPDLAMGAGTGEALKEVVRSAPERVAESAGWLQRSHWAEMTATRERGLAELRRPFPSTVSGRVDVIPFDLAEVIASGLNYSPRPVIQSYSAYAAKLQAMDMAHFAGPKAPDTLFVRLNEIDERLPTGALGPSLPIIAGRYDAVGLDKLGLVLRKRAAARPVARRSLGESRLPLNQWIDVPRAQGVVMGRFELPPSLLGKAVGFLYRDPRMAIHMRSASGVERVYRFVPGMAELGTAISPLPAIGSLGALALLDPAANPRPDPVVALMIEARPWAYKPGAVRFEALDIPAGLASGPGMTLGVMAKLTMSDRSAGAVLDGDEIFAHAPTVLTATISAPMVLTGAAGIRKHPESPAVDGVRFSVEAVDPKGAATVLFDRTLIASGSEAPVNVTIPANSRLVLKTDAMGSTDYDWSFWRLRVAPVGSGGGTP